MQISDWLKKLFQVIFYQKPAKTHNEGEVSFRQPSVKSKLHFTALKVVSKTLGNDSIGKDEFIAVVYENEPFWAMFRCPCGCGTVISLSLQKAHNPSWSVEETDTGRPTLYPSVWQNKGCCSHFWITDGRVHWCNNSGLEPWVAEPTLYSKPRIG